MLNLIFIFQIVLIVKPCNAPVMLLDTNAVNELKVRFIYFLSSYHSDCYS